MQCLFHDKGYLGKNAFFIHSAHDDLEKLVRARSEQLQRKTDAKCIVWSTRTPPLHFTRARGQASLN